MAAPFFPLWTHFTQMNKYMHLSTNLLTTTWYIKFLGTAHMPLWWWFPMKANQLKALWTSFMWTFLCHFSMYINVYSFISTNTASKTFQWTSAADLVAIIKHVMYMVHTCTDSCPLNIYTVIHSTRENDSSLTPFVRLILLSCLCAFCYRKMLYMYAYIYNTGFTWT